MYFIKCNEYIKQLQLDFFAVWGVFFYIVHCVKSKYDCHVELNI